MTSKHPICTRCVMDSSDPGIRFDNEGHCNICSDYLAQKELYDARFSENGKRREAIIHEIKLHGRHKPYDAVVGLSGGVDSAYLLYLAHQLGLRVLALHIDTGWNSEIAVRNIERMCDKLNIHLHTVVIDWPAMKELQRAYMLSEVANLDVPQDHAFMAALRIFAKKHGIKYLLSGANHATEGTGSPFSMQQSYMDARHIRSIYKAHGRGKSLRKYPLASLPKAAWLHATIRTIDLLNEVPYSKQAAIKTLTKVFGWEYYGGKHFESRFTKYFQSVYLPRKFGYDKRRHHLSYLIMNGEITREEALAELACPPYDPKEESEDEAYVLKKLEIPNEQWQQVLRAPPTPNEAYASYGRMLQWVKRLRFRR